MEAGALSPRARARPRVAVVVPALDEEDALARVLSDLPREHLDLLVVVDNGSEDATGRVALEGGARVVREERRGYGQACLTGIDVVLGRRPPDRPDPLDPPLEPLGPDGVVCFLDADHSDFPEELPLVLAPVLAGRADLVVGSRLQQGAGARALLPQARYGNRLACFLMRVLFGARHTDLGPFRAIRVDALEHLGMCDRDFGWTVEMQLKACVAGLRVVEVPVSYRARSGHSKITGTLLGTLRAGWKILGWILGLRLALWVTRPRIPRFR